MVIAELGNRYSIFILICVWEGTKMAKELSGSIRLCNSRLTDLVAKLVVILFNELSPDASVIRLLG
jgi:hypothetical protein